jgi:methyltransferase (TIGR00027 family)
MKRKSGSWTAEGVALFRALESMRPEGERRCYDPLAKDFLNTRFRMVCRSRIRSAIARVYIGFRHGRSAMHIVGRTRYIDYHLVEAIRDGLEQLVILGAGFDSRAYRFDELMNHVQVFEVDHPATQRRKAERLVQMFGNLPEHVTYVPLDFERETLEDRLLDSGYDTELKTMFIWEGVTMYLTAEAVDETLEFIARNSGKGSTIIFDYMYESLLTGTDEATLKFRSYLSRLGEPPQFGIEEGAIEQFLNSRGLLLVENFTDELLKGMHFSKVAKPRLSPMDFAPRGAICLSVIS